MPRRRRQQGCTAGMCCWSSSASSASCSLVNGVMIYSAVSTYTGLVANEPYRKGLHYNDRIDADERQARLGWTTVSSSAATAAWCSCSRTPTATRSPALDRRPLGRPSTNRYDSKLDLARDGAGRYEAQTAPLGPAAGCLAARPRTDARAETVYRTRSAYGSSPEHVALDRTPEPSATAQRRRARHHDHACRREHALRRLHAQGRAGADGRPGRRSARAPISPPSAFPPLRARGRQRRRPRRGAGPRRLHGRRAVAEDADAAKARRSSDFLARMGVAGFAAANVMLLSVSVWAGAARRHAPGGAVAVPLALGADRPAGRCLCRPAVLPLRRAGAARRAASTWTCRSRSASRSPPA